MYSGSAELSQAREGGVADALLWSTTHDRTYYPPQDMRPYAQHLLRCKTTSGLTVDTLHGSVASGAHVLPVNAQAVKSGIAPGEGFYPVRRPNGAREMIEVRYSHKDDAASPSLPPVMGPVRAVSQSHPPQVNLLRHMTVFDLGAQPSETRPSASRQAQGESSRGDTGLSARTEQAAMVAGFAALTPALANFGMTSTTRACHGDLFGPGAELDATISHLKAAGAAATRTSAASTGKAAARLDIPAGLGQQAVPEAGAAPRYTMPRCFKSALGTMLEDEAITGQLRTGKIRVPKGPRAKMTNADKLLYPPDGVPLAQA